jgi:hypothetical protein
MPNTVDPQPLPGEGISPVYARGSLWLIVGSEIAQINPTSLAPVNAFHVAGGPSSLAAGNGALWAGAHDGSLTRVAPDGGETTPLPVGKKLSLSDVAAGAGATWVTVSATA